MFSLLVMDDLPFKRQLIGVLLFNRSIFGECTTNRALLVLSLCEITFPVVMHLRVTILMVMRQRNNTIRRVAFTNPLFNQLYQPCQPGQLPGSIHQIHRRGGFFII